MTLSRLSLASILLFFVGNLHAQLCRESFEGWDGSNKSWLPAGWTTEHNDEDILSVDNGNCVWHVIDPTQTKGMPAASDGKYYAAISFAKQDGEDIYQNEWLISPAYKLSEYGATLNCDLYYAPLFLFYTGNDNLVKDEYGETVFKEERQAADVRILVRKLQADGQWEEDWTVLHSAFNFWYGKQSFSTLLSAFSSVGKRSVPAIFLTDEEYHDATVQFAFQYEGMFGYHAGVDNIVVNYAQILTGVESVTAPLPTLLPTYDLQGRPASHSHKGALQIREGRKYIKY